MEGKLDSPPCVLDTGNPCRYDGLFQQYWHCTPSPLASTRQGRAMLPHLLGNCRKTDIPTRAFVGIGRWRGCAGLASNHCFLGGLATIWTMAQWLLYPCKGHRLYSGCYEEAAMPLSSAWTECKACLARVPNGGEIPARQALHSNSRQGKPCTPTVGETKP